MLSASSFLADAPEGAKLSIDLKPGLTQEELDRRLLRDFDANIRRIFANSLDALLPQRLIPVMVAASGIPAETPVHQITREHARRHCGEGDQPIHDGVKACAKLVFCGRGDRC